MFVTCGAFVCKVCVSIYVRRGRGREGGVGRGREGGVRRGREGGLDNGREVEGGGGGR